MDVKIINFKSAYMSDPRNFDKYGQAYDSYKVCGLGMTNYVFSLLSVASHFIVLGYFMDFWCGQSKLAILYTFQFTVMHAYLWALPDRRYSEWVKDKQTWFIVFAIINLSLYLIGIVLGLVMYFVSNDGMIQFTGIGLIAFQLFANTFMVVCVTLAFINLKGRF